jgi:uncharacterized integral membrane protein
MVKGEQVTKQKVGSIFLIALLMGAIQAIITELKVDWLAYYWIFAFIVSLFMAVVLGNLIELFD